MSKAAQEVESLLNQTQEKATADLIKRLQPRLTRLKEQITPPHKPSVDDLRLREQVLRATSQAQPPSRIRTYPKYLFCQFTSHDFLTGLMVNQLPPTWKEEPSLCSIPKVIKWAKKEDAALGIGAAVGRWYPYTEEGEEWCVFPGQIDEDKGIEYNTAQSMFIWEHQLLPETEESRFGRHRLKVTVELEVPIQHHMHVFPQMGCIGGVRGDIDLALYFGGESVVESVPFLLQRYEGFSKVEDQFDENVVLSAELSAPADMVSYIAGVSASVKAYQNINGTSFAGVNLAGTDANMWVCEGDGPVIVKRVTTALCPEKLVVSP